MNDEQNPNIRILHTYPYMFNPIHGYIDPNNGMALMNLLEPFTWGTPPPPHPPLYFAPSFCFIKVYSWVLRPF